MLQDELIYTGRGLGAGPRHFRNGDITTVGLRNPWGHRAKRQGQCGYR